MKKLLICVLFCLFITSPLFAVTRTVDNCGSASTPNSLAYWEANANRGDVIEIVSGTYDDCSVTWDLAESGTNRLTITAASGNRGDVIFTGNTKFYLRTGYLTFSALQFSSIDSSAIGTIVQDYGDDNLVLDCSFIGFTITQGSGAVMAFGSNSASGVGFTVRDCFFDQLDGYNFRSANFERTYPHTGIIIENSLFQNSTAYTAAYFGDDGDDAYVDMQATFRNNIVRNFTGGGNPEVVGAKGRGVDIYGNIFSNNLGNCVSIRSGGDNNIYNNSFENCRGSIRLQGNNNIVYNNITANTSTTADRPISTISLAGYQAVVDSIIAYNTFIQADNFTGGSDAVFQEGGGGPAQPTGNIIANNQILCEGNKLFYNDGPGWDSPSNTLDTNNIEEWDGDTIICTNCINTIELPLNLTDNTVAGRITKDSVGAINLAIDIAGFTLLFDIDNKTRPGIPYNDIGASELTTPTITGVTLR